MGSMVMSIGTHEVDDRFDVCWVGRTQLGVRSDPGPGGSSA